jgi:hypothetical protein
MKKAPQFDESGYDAKTYAPFKLQNALDTKWKDIRLSFDDWGWIQSTYGTDMIDGYYMNGYGIEGLVKAALFANGLNPDDEETQYDSEGDTCYIHFKDLEQAARAAELAAAMLGDSHTLAELIKIAREQGFED